MELFTNKNLALKLIPFVSPLEETPADISDTRYSHVDSGLSAVEISKFYNDLISTPSKPTQTNKLLEKFVPKIKNVNIVPKSDTNDYISSNSIFRFAQEGNVTGLKQCINRGYSVDYQDSYGWTPLMCATCEGHYFCVEYLLQVGANVGVKCKNGMTAMDIAKKINNFPIMQLLQNGLPQIPSSSFQPTSVVQKVVKKYCESCKLYYETTTAVHERSIAHLVNKSTSNLSTFYHIPENNKGFQIMLKNGWDKNKGLGLKAEGRKFPIKTVLKKDRSCIGKIKEVPKVTHFSANDESSVKGNKNIPIKSVREQTLKKWERERIGRINRQKEINFRRQFHNDI